MTEMRERFSLLRASRWALTAISRAQFFGGDPAGLGLMPAVAAPSYAPVYATAIFGGWRSPIVIIGDTSARFCWAR